TRSKHDSRISKVFVFRSFELVSVFEIRISELELQPSLSRRVGQRLDAAMIPIVPTIEANLRHALALGDLGQLLADGDGGVLVAALGFPLVAPALGTPAHSLQRHPLHLINNLGVNVLVRANHS